ncbi:Vacuolar ATP synthase subunit H [Giardia muris]|uniref:Vacuolar ATP synthase subunit H n=1 Tax=Giardia muris TaxID=5742 RepID=A0A4Z1SVD3_GIAMU|nr:Vacuolar ATP synthase subunit H [Giardia muris]|eukprot:TNJ27548.1 Vacuolar ATP synthase subunit H [Giardia muris]
MADLVQFLAALRLRNLCGHVNQGETEIGAAFWSDYLTRSKRYSDAGSHLRDDILSYGIGQLHNAKAEEKTFVSAILLRLYDFCQLDPGFGQKFIQRADQLLIDVIIGGFEGQDDQMAPLRYTPLSVHTISPATQHLDSKDEIVEKQAVASLECDVDPLTITYSRNCYLIALDTFLAQLAHQIPETHKLFYYACHSAERLVEVVLKYKEFNTTLVGNALQLLARLMRNPIIQAFILCSERFEHRTMDINYMANFAARFLQTRRVRGDFVPHLFSMISEYLPGLYSSGAVEFPIIYGSLMCIWMASFIDQPTLLKLGIFVLCSRILTNRLAQGVSRVVRMALKTLLNVSTCDEAIDMMVVSNIEPTLLSMEAKSWRDVGGEACIPDLITSIRALSDASLRRVTTWEAYLTELRSNLLHMSPVHTSESFWKNNAQHFLDNKSYGLRRLAEIGSSSVDPESVLVCLNDIGMFAVAHSNGRAIVSRLPEVKAFVMKCLEHEHETVRNEAIATLSKILVDNWRSV